VISKSRGKARELNLTQIHSFISILQVEVLPTYIGLNIQQKPMKNKAKTTDQMEKGKGSKVSKYKSKCKKLSALFRTAASTLNKHIFQNTCPNGFIPKLGKIPKCLFSGKTSCRLRFLAVGKLDPDKDKCLSTAIRLHLFGIFLLLKPQPRI